MNLLNNDLNIDYFRILLFFIALYIGTKKWELDKGSILVAIFYLVVVQVLYSLNFNGVVNFVDNYYPTGEYNGYLNPEFIDLGNIQAFRLAGLFHNPNEMAIAVLILFMLYTKVQENNKSKLYALVSVICLLSILLTGSRSAGFVYIFFLLIGNYKSLMKNSAITFIAILILICCLTYYYYEFISEFRLFAEFNSIQNNGKQELFYDYYLYIGNLDSISFLKDLLFGRLNTEIFMDSEFGYYFEFFGFFGLLAYLVFIVVVFLNTVKQRWHYLSIFLLCFGATLTFHAYLIFPITMFWTMLKNNELCVDSPVK